MADKPPLHSGKPLKPEDRDYLGLEPLADRLAEVLCDKSLKDGFVLGVEGPWGSGKSSLLKKTIKKLETLKEPPTIVEFNPWLVGDKLELIKEYFIALNEALERELGGDTGKTDKAKKQVKEGLQKYAKHFNAGAQWLSIGALLIPQLEVGSKAIKKIVEGFEELSEPEPLHKQKEKLEQALEKISRPIVVFVDDTERLDPPEVMETLRLLRSVGDLPNIIYVVAYDRTAMVRNIGLALKAEELETTGASYLEKIVQATITIPRPEDFTLRRWFKAEILELHRLDKESPLQGDSLERLELVVDKEGGRMISTPRDLIRLMNNIKIVWPAIRDFVDIGDLVWIQLLKLKKPKLYYWVENYLNGFAEVARGTARASDAEEQYLKLVEHAAPDYEPESISFYHLARILPGLEKQSYGPDESQWTTFSINEEQIEELTRFRRLGSPHYYRYYFALGQNQGFVPAEDIRAALGELQKCSRKLKVRLLSAAEERFQDLELHYPVLLDSLRPHLPSLSVESQRFFINCILASAESAIRNRPSESPVSNRSVSSAKAVIYSALENDPQGLKTFKEILKDAPSISLVAHMISDVVHDRYSGVSLTGPQAQEIKQAFFDRVSKDADRLSSAASPNLVLSMWGQCSTNKEEFKKSLKKLFEDTNTLILIAGAKDSRSTVYSTAGNWKPLDIKYYEDISGMPELGQRIEEAILARHTFSADLQPYFDIIVSGLKDQKEYNGRWD